MHSHMPSTYQTTPTHPPPLRFIIAIRGVILAETHTLKRAILFRLSIVLTAAFLVLPFVEFVGGVVSAADDRYRVFDVDR